MKDPQCNLANLPGQGWNDAVPWFSFQGALTFATAPLRTCRLSPPFFSFQRGRRVWRGSLMLLAANETLHRCVSPPNGGIHQQSARHNVENKRGISGDPSFSGEDASERIWVVFSINSPTISLGHAQHCTFSTSVPIHYPPRPHVLFCPLCIPQLSLGANLLVEAFWLHLPFKSYRLKLDISSLSCSSIAWDPWDCLPSALVSTVAQSTFPPLKILQLSWCCWGFACYRNKIHRICTFVSSWLPDSCFIVCWHCRKPVAFSLCL